MSVLGTKLHIPSPRRRLVQRARLTDHLHGDEGGAPRLVLVAAPAGFGKTTLLAQWLAAGGGAQAAPRLVFRRAGRRAGTPGFIPPPLAGYSHHIELDQSERLLVISGQVGMTQDGQVPGDPGEQFDLALANVLRNVEAAGMS